MFYSVSNFGLSGRYYALATKIAQGIVRHPERAGVPRSDIYELWGFAAAVKFCEWNIVQRAKPNVPLGTFGIYEELLCTFLNTKLLFIRWFVYKIFLYVKKATETPK